mgnify:CR=1 FL=1
MFHFSTGTSGYKFDGSTENTKYTSAQTEKLYSLRESSLKRESSRTGNTNLTQITDVTVDKLSQKEFTRTWAGVKTFGILLL